MKKRIFIAIELTLFLFSFSAAWASGPEASRPPLSPDALLKLDPYFPDNGTELGPAEMQELGIHLPNGAKAYYILVPFIPEPDGFTVIVPKRVRIRYHREGWEWRGKTQWIAGGSVPYVYWELPEGTPKSSLLPLERILLGVKLKRSWLEGDPADALWAQIDSLVSKTYLEYAAQVGSLRRGP
ncbi:hypothetical protein [Candidatus Methylacidithermus pantelleriae]|uniref:Uncharacterized protein n=1 Tax=Candidatus Methylacidithermus pantelleriae TaxID=2744239 RepID=A0A8J2BPR1_9BACT|nr:hypothetical protein [Candidatus Methylacidithermus pantelleriae]CAF0704952.1 exported hypothetical protein [Candidatus Methylacidithermus pantelleriae]